MVPFPFLKRRGHRLKGSRCDFSHQFTTLNERGSKPKQDPFESFPSPHIPDVLMTSQQGTPVKMTMSLTSFQ